MLNIFSLALIKESVNVGSIAIALEEKKILPESLLEWLGTVPATKETLIAYKHLCSKFPDLPQQDFLQKNPSYKPIADALKSHYDGNDRFSYEFITMICQGLGHESYIVRSLNYCYKARFFPHLHCSVDVINKALVEADWTERFRYNNKLARLVLNRVVYLQENAQSYYSRIAYTKYRDVIVRMQKQHLFSNFDQEELKLVDSFFPGVIDGRLLKYSGIAYKISVLDNEIAGYYLGFPIHTVIPDKVQIDKALDMLNEVGVDGYAEHIKSYTKSSYKPILPFDTREVIYSNETDVTYEDPDDYVSFDIVVYQTGNYIYRFTRPEFSAILETKKNPWTNEWIPASILSTINTRYLTAKELGLPLSAPMKELLKAEFCTEKAKEEPRNPFRSAYERAESELQQDDINVYNAMYNDMYRTLLDMFGEADDDGDEEEPNFDSMMVMDYADIPFMVPVEGVLETNLVPAQQGILNSRIFGVPAHRENSGTLLALIFNAEEPVVQPYTINDNPDISVILRAAAEADASPIPSSAIESEPFNIEHSLYYNNVTNYVCYKYENRIYYIAHYDFETNRASILNTDFILSSIEHGIKCITFPEEFYSRITPSFL